MSPDFARFAGACAILVGVLGFLYSLAFAVDLATGARWADTAGEVLLLAGGLLTAAVFVGVYERLRETDRGFALLALVLGLAASFGAAGHGAFNLAVRLDPVAPVTAIPNPIDPRGFLTFGVAGVALLLVGWLARRGAFPAGLGWLAQVAGVLLLVVYAGRLVVLVEDNPLIVVPAVLVGFVVNPALYVWLGFVLRREREAIGAPEP